jgi:hypothetical protein
MIVINFEVKVNVDLRWDEVTDLDLALVARHLVNFV